MPESILTTAAAARVWDTWTQQHLLILLVTSPKLGPATRTPDFLLQPEFSITTAPDWQCVGAGPPCVNPVFVKTFRMVTGHKA